MAVTKGMMGGGNRGLLINMKTGEQVDLFVINHEEVSVTNDITGENISDGSHINEHIEMHPAQVIVEGKLLPSKYSGGKGPVPTGFGDDITGQKAKEKLKTIIKFCNDVRPKTRYKLIAPALPFTYLEYYPTDFNYSNEGESNSIDFSLTLEEIGMRKKLKRSDPAKKVTAGTSIKNHSSKEQSRYHATIAAPTEDGGGQKERGKITGRSINSVLKVDSLTEKMRDESIETDALGVSTVEAINKLIGVDEPLAERATMLSLQGRYKAGGRQTFADPTVEGDLGRALSQMLEGISFPAGNLLDDSELAEKQIIENIPLVGQLLKNVKSMTTDSESIIEAVRSNQSTVLFTMRSPVLRKLRYKIIQEGTDVSRGVRQRIERSIPLSTRENRLLKDAFIDGMDTLRERETEFEDLMGFVSNLPDRPSKQGLTYYNYYGQPAIQFKEIVEPNFERWSTHTLELGEEEYELETYWNKAGFPVFSITDSDGMKVVKQRRAFLGIDLLTTAQDIPNLEGIHLVPFSTDDSVDELTQDSVNSSVFFMIIHTNSRGLKEVL
ncbi:MAG: hypothetical protein K9L56_13510 [Clostridiales bacterium]|nr:hypothetical protein [Clostridiales bacterium]